MNTWSAILDSCPGLLCCVINLQGKLLYASHGYKAVAARLFGHKCTEGSNYPPLITELDRAFHDVLTAACLGEVNAIEISENEKIWELTASPLRLEQNSKKIEGVVVRIMSENQVIEKNSQPVIQTDPEILEAVPFRACVVNQKGMILAANKFFSKSSKGNLTGKNIIEIFKPSSNSGIMKIISKRRGSVEGKIPELIINENFCDDLFLDKELNKPSEEKSENSRILKVHATPIKWHDAESVLLTFEDISEFARTKDQLRRILTFDSSTGILNRRGIEHILLRDFGDAIRDSEDLSLIMINIDNFAVLNEISGYLAGNRTIRGFTTTMKNILSNYSQSVIARWSGDEFLILSHCSGAAAVVIANEIREKASGIEISAGIADLNTGNYAGVNDFIGAAYNAMTEAKSSGKNSTVLAK
ncbi:MAG: GGDEF domain-containing protein [Synergistaceae bacterium]|nr:GGDEF domain-containing protein [Synergistaceae bacterium]